jgi:ribosomal protein S18 acetylase RimI-like enzyme
LSRLDVTFRFAEPADTPTVVSLVESAYRGESSRKGWTTEADLLHGQRTDPEEIRSILEDQNARLILGIVSGRISATILVRKKDSRAYIGMVSVNPEQQGQGFGRALLTQGESCARETFRCSSAYMTVLLQRAELIRWYERQGYVYTGKREPFPYGNPRFGLPQRQDLEFVVLEKVLHS